MAPEVDLAWIARRADADVLAATRRAMAGYPEEYASRADPRLPPAVRQDSIVGTHSQLPAVLEPIFVALRELFDPALPLTRRQQEMIATVVSAENDCFF